MSPFPCHNAVYLPYASEMRAAIVATASCFLSDARIIPTHTNLPPTVRGDLSSAMPEMATYTASGVLRVRRQSRGLLEAGVISADVYAYFCYGALRMVLDYQSGSNLPTSYPKVSIADDAGAASARSEQEGFSQGCCITTTTTYQCRYTYYSSPCHA